MAVSGFRVPPLRGWDVFFSAPRQNSRFLAAASRRFGMTSRRGDREQ
jgi:hypothetical protein